MPEPFIDFMRGGMLVSCLGIALFFLRFWRESKENLFALFAASFLVLGVSQHLALVSGSSGDFVPLTYLLRLLAFVLIILGIITKNLPKNTNSTASPESKPDE